MPVVRVVVDAGCGRPADGDGGAAEPLPAGVHQLAGDGAGTADQVDGQRGVLLAGAELDDDGLRPVGGLREGDDVGAGGRQVGEGETADVADGRGRGGDLDAVDGRGDGDAAERRRAGRPPCRRSPRRRRRAGRWPPSGPGRRRPSARSWSGRSRGGEGQLVGVRSRQVGEDVAAAGVRGRGRRRCGGVGLGAGSQAGPRDDGGRHHLERVAEVDQAADRRGQPDDAGCPCRRRRPARTRPPRWRRSRWARTGTRRWCSPVR